MKISHFCWETELKAAVNFLAIYGMVISIIGSLVAAFLFLLPLILNVDLYVEIYTGATFVLLTKFGWFAFSYKLHKKNTNENVTGVKKMIKIGSYIIGSVQAAPFALLVIFGVILIAFGQGYKVTGCILTPIGIFFLIFPSLLLDGIRRKHAGKIKAWIIFNLVILGFVLALNMVQLLFAGQFLTTILQIIVFTLGFMYCFGMVIVHYNILLDDENILKSALNNYTKNGNNMDNQKQMTDFPPPYSQVV